MKRQTQLNLLISAALLLTWCQAAVSFAQEAQSSAPTRSDFVSDASFVVGTFLLDQSDHSPQAMADATNAFLNGLSDEQRRLAQHDLRSPERRAWTNLPARNGAGGVTLGSLSKDQVKLACQMMANLFSDHGFNKLRDIMLADDQLLRGGQRRGGFGTENFAFVVFGKPSVTEPWAIQIDGHHVGVNLAIKGDAITMSPSFIGTQPKAFSIAGRQHEPLKNETELAHAIAESLTDEQVKSAIIGQRRGRIMAGPGKDGFIPDALGVSCSTFSDMQKKQLLELISQWVNDLPPAQAARRMEEVETEIDKMKFSWNGKRALGSDVSYRIQSPSLIIEYACQDLGGNPLEHLHSNYRNPLNDYGQQLK